MKLPRLVCCALAFAACTFAACGPKDGSGNGNGGGGGGGGSPDAVTIVVDAAARLQTMRGWEATAQAGQEDSPAFDRYASQLFDLAANDLGIDRLRVEMYSGVENSVDYHALYISGRISEAEWRAHRFEVINDNGDPAALEPSGFQFSALDLTVGRVVEPMRSRLAQRGERLSVTVTYVDFGSGEHVHRENPEEYAELVLATYLHLRDRWGWVPDAWEVALEPDNTPWSGADLGRAMAASARRLRAAGFTPAFIAPSCTSMSNVLRYVDGLAGVPGAAEVLAELSYHRYGGVSDSNLRDIADRAAAMGIAPAMLEHIGSGYEDLHRDLTLGRNTAWQQYTLAYPTDDNGAQYYVIRDDNPDAPQVILGSRTRFLRQYFKHVRIGATRVAANVQEGGPEALAFINRDGSYVVIVKSEAAVSFAVRGLPAGTYGGFYTTAAEFDVRVSDRAIANGQVFEARLPAAGVVTIVRRGGTSQTTTQTEAGPQAGAAPPAAAAVPRSASSSPRGSAGNSPALGIAPSTSGSDRAAGSAAHLPVLSVALAGSGTVLVLSTPEGISCPPACSARLAPGTGLTLRTLTAGLQHFAGWQGGESCGRVKAGDRDISCTAVIRTLPAGRPLDFDGDGLADVLLYDPADGTWSVEGGNGRGDFRATTSGLAPPGRTIRAADFDGNGLADLMLYDPETGRWDTGLNAGGARFAWSGGRFPPAHELLVLDLDGDRRSDVLLRDAVSGRYRRCLRQPTGFGCAPASWGASWNVQPARQAGGGDRLLLFRPESGEVAWLDPATGSRLERRFEPFDQGYAGRFGASDAPALLLYDSGTGTWSIVSSNAGAGVQGGGTWLPRAALVVADFDGNGRSDVFVYQRATGRWIEALDAGGSFRQRSGQWAAGWTPDVTDIDGNGSAELLMHEPSQGLWSVALRAANGVFRFAEGSWPAGRFLLAAR